MQISEIFYSLQGEGSLTGVPSVFIRTSGCNLRCSWCDTKYASWTPEDRELPLETIVAEALHFPARHIVLTGGEPMTAQGMPELASALRAHGKHITIETNGTVAPHGLEVDLASISPKLRNSVADPQKHPREANMQAEDRRWNVAALRSWIDQYDYQLKFVVTSSEDLAEIQELLGKLQRRVPPDRVMLMPEGMDMETIRSRDADLIEVCKRYGYRYCRRLHIEWFGNKRGT